MSAAAAEREAAFEANAPIAVEETTVVINSSVNVSKPFRGIPSYFPGYARYYLTLSHAFILNYVLPTFFSAGEYNFDKTITSKRTG